MKRILFICLLLISKIAICQKNLDKKIYLDSLFIATKSNEYKYTRIVENYFIEQNEYRVKDFYLSGELQMEGTFTDKECIKKNGDFIYFYENGVKKYKNKYVNNIEKDFYESWYNDGTLKETGFYSSVTDKENKYSITNFWDTNKKQTVVDGNGIYNCENDNEKLTGKYADGNKVGVWTGTIKQMKISYIENYTEGKLIKGQSTDFFGEVYNYDEVQLKPAPRQGFSHFYNYIGRKFKVPLVEGLAGKLILKFVVEIDGSINEINVVKSIGYGADEEGIRVLKNYTDWIPGKLRGIKTRCYFQIPISIQAAR